MKLKEIIARIKALEKAVYGNEAKFQAQDKVIIPKNPRDRK